MAMVMGELGPLKELRRELEGEFGAEAVYCLEERLEDPFWGDIFLVFVCACVYLCFFRRVS